MKNKFWICAAVLCANLLILSCGSNQQGFRHPVLRQIHAQISQSCGVEGLRYEKVVTSYEDGRDQVGDSTFVLRDTCQLLVDLQYAFKQTVLEPGILDYFQVSQHGDTMVAVIQPGEESRADIQSQKILFSQSDSSVTYLHLSLKKQQFLYDLEASLEIQFDSDGKYLTHHQQVDISISGGNQYRAETKGKLLEP